MKFSILTIFPEFFDGLKDYSIIARAIKNNLIEVETVNIRDFSNDKHKKVDDYPYGGGPGMLMQVEPIYRSIESVRTDKSRVIYLSPHGKRLNQAKLVELSKEDHLVLLNGHYEGIDYRIVENYVDEEISIGDFVLTGAEIASMLIVDGVSRLIPGVLSSEESYMEESFYNGFLEYPQYTRPRTFNDLSVPDILLSGDHEKIREYRKFMSLKLTYLKRPDLIDREKLSDYEKELLSKIEEGR
ncbi:tRNA (guanosine(37)-N1)-methyltransferase TrmD [Peptoniphilus obesi]|uniref:tRNA (guanosine(37)-N1)-methyltransferase TrmD n=1 Tax=Peptoniphilus obesi TaxID=1472765 RepID=UPI0004B80817|nr:tRNA (guanosine(37)-N1)-methyltransferase TrmD [Peptoniphilus obesi]